MLYAPPLTVDQIRRQYCRSPLTEEVSPFAWLPHPPLTVECKTCSRTLIAAKDCDFSPVALFWAPPVTDENSPLVQFLDPNHNPAKLAVVVPCSNHEHVRAATVVGRIFIVLTGAQFIVADDHVTKPVDALCLSLTVYHM